MMEILLMRLYLVESAYRRPAQELRYNWFMLLHTVGEEMRVFDMLEWADRHLGDFYKTLAGKQETNNGKH